MRRLFATSSFRLATAYAAVTALGYLVLFMLTYWIASDALNRQIRSGIETEFQALLTEHREVGGEEFTRRLAERLQTRGAAAFYYLVSDASGRKLAGNLSAAAPFDGWRETLFDPVQPGETASPDSVDEDHQLLAKAATLTDGTHLVVGADHYRVLTAQEALVNAFAWSSGITLALAVFAGLMISRSYVRRIDQINATSSAIIKGNLKERIPERGTSDEIDRLAANLNTMLDSNQSLMDSLRQVSTSIAHDLRTPLARLQQTLDDARLQSFTPSAYQRLLEQASAEVDRILATFSALLRIAHIESGVRRAGFAPVDLTALCERIAEAYRAVAEDSGKVMQVLIAPGAWTVGDGELLVQLLANLVENAIKHTQQDALIELTLIQGETGPELSVSDNGPGIPEQERKRVFEHFYRLDHSRTTQGYGLGMSLVAAIAKIHDVSIKLKDNSPGLTVHLAFPPAGNAQRLVEAHGPDVMDATADPSRPLMH